MTKNQRHRNVRREIVTEREPERQRAEQRHRQSEGVIQRKNGRQRHSNTEREADRPGPSDRISENSAGDPQGGMSKERQQVGRERRDVESPMWEQRAR